MCVIVDVNAALGFLDEYVLDPLLSGDKPIPLALGGGRHADELIGNPKKGVPGNHRIGEVFDEIRRQSKKFPKLNLLTEYEAKQLQREEKKLPPYKSDDPHILALAIVSGSRLLVSCDKDLKKDFRSKKIVSAVTWGDGKNDGGKILPLGHNRSQKQKRETLFETMPRCVQRHLRAGRTQQRFN